MGYSAGLEIPADTGATSMYAVTNGYASSEYVVTSAVSNDVGMTQQDLGMTQHNGVGMTEQYCDAVTTSNHPMLTYTNQYSGMTAPGALVTTVPYCTPLVADNTTPYIVPHAAPISYTHPVSMRVCWLNCNFKFLCQSENS